MSLKVAVVGAGIYGSTAAIRLAQAGHSVTLFDPLGILQAASAINQYRVHAGYHYPRSPETIAEVQEARAEFIQEFAPAIVRNREHFYAVPKQGSATTADDFERVMREFRLPLYEERPDWMSFDYIERCWRVEESLYDPDILRQTIGEKLQAARVPFLRETFREEMAHDWDIVVWATYGLHPSRRILPNMKVQVAEKILIRLPPRLRHVSLVVVDGPFTAFDPYGNSELSLFGSARYTNRWESDDHLAPIPEVFLSRLNEPEFRPIPDSTFQDMVDDSCQTVPLAREATYLGSRFTLRVVEFNPQRDQRLLYVSKADAKNIYIFSGKVVGAVKAARSVTDLVNHV